MTKASTALALEHLRAAMTEATEAGLLDELQSICRSPDSINDVCDAAARMALVARWGCRTAALSKAMTKRPFIGEPDRPPKVELTEVQCQKEGDLFWVPFVYQVARTFGFRCPVCGSKRCVATGRVYHAELAKDYAKTQGAAARVQRP
jgi:hypothetical protein